MKYFTLLVSLAGVVLSGCAEEKNLKSPLADYSVVDGNCLKTSYDALFPGGYVICQEHISPAQKEVWSSCEERGAYKNVNYIISYQTCDAVIQDEGIDLPDYYDFFRRDPGDNWRMRCRLNPNSLMSAGSSDTHNLANKNARECYLFRGDLSIGLGVDGAAFVTLGVGHRPRSEIIVQVDDSAPITAPSLDGFSREQSQTILNEMRSGTKFTGHYQKWVHQENIETVLDLDHFNVAWEILEVVWRQSNARRNRWAGNGR
jgi:hypothetical protein